MGNSKKIGAIALVLGLCASPVLAGNVVEPDKVVFKDDFEIVDSLTGTPGDSAKGREWFANRKLGNCLACHQNAELSEQAFHGEIGPTMDGVADRYSESQLRAIVVNSKVVFGEETVMPGFYRTSGLNRVAEKFAGKPILTAEQVEDVVAYLLTLKE